MVYNMYGMGILRWFLRRDLRVQVALVLVPITLATPLSFHEAWPSVVFHLLASLGFTVAFDLLVTRILIKRWVFPRAALVTGLLVGLVLSQESSLAWKALAAYFAVFSKHFIRVKGKHLVNPAAFGLVAAELLALAMGRGTLITWWGVSAAATWTIPVLLLGMGLVLSRLRILFLPLGFLLVYASTLVSLAGGVRQLVVLLLDPAVFLFTMVMLTEYKTSPIVGYWRYSFGLFVSAIWLVLIDVVGIIRPDPLLVSLLIGDLMSFAVRRMRFSFAGAKAAKAI